MHGWGWMLLLCALGFNADAQSRVYKCIDGAVPVYQQTPCQGQAEWRWEIPEEASQARAGATAVTPAQRGPRGRPQRLRRAAAAAAGQGGVIGWATDVAGCSAARQRRAQRLATAGRLDYLQQRQLDDAVQAACR